VALGGLVCRLCGCGPAADVTFRGHQGMIIVMRFLTSRGPFCRDCGLAVFRTMTARTLVQGWYGYISFIVAPLTVMLNLHRRGKIANLLPPTPTPFGHGRPLDPGPRLLARPMALFGLLIPFTIVMFLVVSAACSGG